jgi:hypothetical protein
MNRSYESALRASLFDPARLFFRCRTCGRELLFGTRCWCMHPPAPGGG